MNYRKLSTSSNSLKKYSISDREFLNKRLQTSSRYTNVKSRTNSGFNASRRQEIEKEIHKYYKVRNDEVFQRISLGDLMHLMVIYAEESNLLRPDLMGFQETDNEGGGQNQQEEVSQAPFKVHVDDVIHKMENLDIPPPNPADDSTCPPRPFLILDLRPFTAFCRGHLPTAVSHPLDRLSRAVGWECEAMLAFKNHPEWILVLCDEDETLSPRGAATLLHRGYDNTFVLSGGLRLIRDKIGPPLLTSEQEDAFPPSVADFLAQKLSCVLLPPLRVGEAADWWAANASDSRRSRSEESGFEGRRGRSRSRGRLHPEDKKKPWR